MSASINIATQGPGRRVRAGLSDSEFALIVVGSLILFNTAIVIAPLIYSFWISLHDTNVILHKLEFVGLDHYATIAEEPEVRRALGLTLIFTAIAVILSLVIGLGMALVLDHDFPGRGTLRAVVLLPWAVSEVVTATMWIFIVNPTFGALNGILSYVHLATNSTDWLTPHMAIFWVALAFVWHVAPLGTFFFLAALQTVPRDLYRAARIDRAGPVSRFIHITLPHLKYVVLIVLVVVTVEAFREFDLVFSFTRGGPGTATQILPLLIYRYNFEFSQYGLAAAASYLLILIAMLLTTVYFVLLTYRKRQVRQVEAVFGPRAEVAS